LYAHVMELDIGQIGGARQHGFSLFCILAFGG